MKVGRTAYVTAEWGGVTRGGIGETVRAAVLADPEDSLVVVEASASIVKRIRMSLPAGFALECVADRAADALPRRVFRSEAHWRSHRLWCALRAIAEEQPVDAVEFPDFDGPGFVTIKARRLGIGPPLPPIQVRLHGSVARTAAADGRAMLSLEAKQRLAMERYALRYADRILAPSEAVLAEYAAAQTLAAERILARPAFDAPAKRVASPPATLPLRIGFLGKLQPLKGAATLVQAAVQVLEKRGIDSLEVHLVGGDETGAFLASHQEELRRSLPAAFAARFRFHGALARTEAHRRLAETHAAVVPSRTETFGLAARELAATGLPLAVTDLGAFRDLEADVAEASVERFPVDDVEALVSILDRWCGSLEAGTWPPSRPRVEERPTPVPADPVPDAPSLAIPRSAPPRVSVVVPYYEMPTWLEACLASVAADPHPDKEIIVIDDGTRTPAGRGGLERAVADFHGCPIRVLRKENGGLASARNAGLAVATGDYVLPLDPDDLIVPGYLVAAVAALERHRDLDWVNGISAAFDETGSVEAARDWVVPYDPDPGMLFYENGCGTAAAVFRREVLAEYAYREDLPAYEDWDLHLRLALDGRRGEGLPEVFHRYRQRRRGLAAAAHLRHAELVSKVIGPALSALPPEFRSAFEIHLASSSGLRGLGGARAGVRGALFMRVGSLYRSHVKDALGRVVGEATRDRVVHGLRRRFLETTARRSDR